MSDHLRYFFLASGPMMLCSALQWPSGAVKISCIFASALCIWLGAAFGVVEVANRPTRSVQKST